MRKWLFLLGICLLWASPVHAQTTTLVATWTQTDTNPATFTYFATRNTTAPVQLTAVTCAGSACQGTITYTGVTIASGDSFTLQAKSPNGLLSQPSLPFVLTGPNRPGTVTITITIVGP